MYSRVLTPVVTARSDDVALAALASSSVGALPSSRSCSSSVSSILVIDESPCFSDCSSFGEHEGSDSSIVYTCATSPADHS